MISRPVKETVTINYTTIVEQIKDIMLHSEFLKNDSNSMAQTRINMLTGRIDMLEGLGLVTTSGADELRSIIDDAESKRLKW